MLNRHYAGVAHPMPDALLRSKEQSTGPLTAELGFNREFV